MRQTIIIPRFLMRATACQWRIDWRGQGAVSGLDGSDQIIYNAFPRWVGTAQVSLRGDMGRVWRALIARGQGRVNCYSVPMVDPIARQLDAPADFWRASLEDYLAGRYVEPRPTITCAADAAAGAETITVDERAAARPVRVGSILSAADWPFVVTGRSGSGAATVLEVEMPLRRAIAAGAQIDLAPRGLFVATDDAMGWPSFAGSTSQAPTLDLAEWITRP